ncbi:hypothetical protein J2W23_003989 [Variovorax boronicumulans]|nr:hypothetical protein [Variovorax boronicumulans]
MPTLRATRPKAIRRGTTGIVHSNLDFHGVA